MDLSWLWDKYSDEPKDASLKEVAAMREDIFYLKGIIEGMRIFMEQKT